MGSGAHPCGCIGWAKQRGGQAARPAQASGSRQPQFARRLPPTADLDEFWLRARHCAPAAHLSPNSSSPPGRASSAHAKRAPTMIQLKVRRRRAAPQNSHTPLTRIDPHQLHRQLRRRHSRVCQRPAIEASRESWYAVRREVVREEADRCRRPDSRGR